MLTLDPATVSDLIAEGDTRWINRGARADPHGRRRRRDPGPRRRVPAEPPPCYGPLPGPNSRPSRPSPARLTRSHLPSAAATGLRRRPRSTSPDVSHRADARDGQPARRRARARCRSRSLNFSGRGAERARCAESTCRRGPTITDLFTDGAARARSTTSTASASRSTPTAGPRCSSRRRSRPRRPTGRRGGWSRRASLRVERRPQVTLRRLEEPARVRRTASRSS